MRGAIPPLTQYVFMALFLVKSIGTTLPLPLLYRTEFRILFEKLIVTQLVKKYPAFLRNPEVHHRVHKSPPLDPILSQRISPGPRHFETFRNNRKIFTVRGCGPTPNPQAGGPPLVGCQRLLIRYIRSYPPYPEDFPLSAT
jgi:hypothetical protein